MRQREKYANVPADALAAGLVEIHDLLARVSKGDTAQSDVVESETGIFSEIKKLINELAMHMQQTNDYTHEMAIGLCEHYETLNRIASGDFSGRASVDSGIEVVAKLGELINLEADALTNAISRAQHAEETAKYAYQQLLDIVEFLPDATFVVDQDKRVIAWNRAIEKMTGIEKQEIIGKGDYEYALPFYGERRPILIDLIDESPDAARHKYKYIKNEGRTLYTEAFVPTFRNLGIRYFWATATPLFNKEGKQIGGIESIRDITEYKSAEEEKLRLESQLNKAQIMETLMVRLGHDLKTPLTPLFIMLSLLKKRLSEPDLIKMVDTCMKSATTINNLTDKTRILATLSSSVKPYELEVVSLAAIVDQAVVGLCGHACQKSRLTAGTVLTPHCLSRLCRPSCMNCLSILFQMPFIFRLKKSVIFITAERDAEAVVISVRDQGVGLAPAHLEHIFDEFFKADESRHNIDASGLGLSICKRVVQNHHGRIWAESPGPGLGTTIKFTLNERVPE